MMHGQKNIKICIVVEGLHRKTS